MLARLHHPGIAQVYEVGVHKDAAGQTPFFAMEYVEGAAPITQFAAQQNLGTRERVALMAAVCEAVQHAHAKGVVHRDLKPSNLLVCGGAPDANGGSAIEDSRAGVSGRPDSTTRDPRSLPPVKIIDFGIALATDSDIAVTTMRTDVGQLIGTLLYMSPEQCAGDSRDIDTRSDVYSLGVVLYELLTGRAPYDLGTVPIPEACRVIREQPPRRPSAVHPVLRGDLETITMKALEKDRSRRYQSASELGADLLRFLRDEPIVARPASAIYQLRKFARRNRTLVGGVVATILALAVGLALATLFAVRADQSKLQAQQATRELRTAIQSAARSLWSEETAFRGSQNLLENLDPLDRPVPTAQTAVWMHNQDLEYYDTAGSVVARLSLRVQIPECVRPGQPAQDFEILGAIMADLYPQHPGRELAVLLAPKPPSNLHDSVLRIYDSKLNPLQELWNKGELNNLWWDDRSRLLVVTGHSSLLPYYLPQLTRYDSAGCPEIRYDPAMVVALEPSNARGVLFPLAGDRDHPPAAPRWIIALRPAQVGKLSHPDIQSLDAPDEGRADAIGKLHLRARPPGASLTTPLTWFSAHLNPEGRPLEPIVADNRGGTLDFEDSLVRIDDIPRRQRAASLVEPLLRGGATPEQAHAAAAQEDPSLAPFAAESAQAMLGNWRWLNNASGDIVEHPQGHSEADFARALEWSRQAERIHKEHCPDSDHCVAGWFATNTLGIALYRAGFFQEAFDVLSRWELNNPHDPRPEDLAFMAIAQFKLGNREQARSLLARAIAALRDADRRPGGVGDATGPVEEARQLLGD
jgi:hypothetical protein